MLRRLWGLVVIMQALMPLLLILVLLLVTGQMISDVRKVVGNRLDTISKHASNMERRLSVAQQAATSLRGDVAGVQQTANALNTTLQVNFGMVSLANLNKTFDVLGLGQAKTLFQQTGGLFNKMIDMLGMVDIAQDANAMVSEVQSIGKGLAAALDKWGSAVLVISFLACILLVIWYVDYVLRSLRRGWALWCGEPDPWHWTPPASPPTTRWTGR